MSWMPNIGRCSNSNSMLHVVFAQVGAPFPSSNHGMNFKIISSKTHTFRTIKTHRPNICRFKIIFCDHLSLSLIKGVCIIGYFHAQNSSRVKKPLSMLLKFKNSWTMIGFISPYPFKSTHAIVQSMSENMNLCLSPIQPLSIHPDEAISVFHCHHKTLLKLNINDEIIPISFGYSSNISYLTLCSQKTI